MKFTNEQRDFILEIQKSEFIKPNEQNSKEPMEFILDEIKEIYGKKDYDTLKDFSRCQSLIIALGRTGKFKEGDKVILLAKKTLNSLRGELRTLGCIFLYPSFAYYAKKQDDLKLARKYISLVIKHNDALTPKFPILHLHKLHHTININQLLLAKGKYKECAQFMISIFSYLLTFELKSEYGIGGEYIFKQMEPEFSHSDAAARFMNEYFNCVWENPEVLNYILENKNFEKTLNETKAPETYTSAIKDLWFIQKSFSSSDGNYNLIYSFFEKYDFYTFDPLRLLILQKIYHSLKCEDDKSLILDSMIKKLNFKYPDLLVERFSQKQLCLNE
jgi:hypothetical protein